MKKLKKFLILLIVTAVLAAAFGCQKNAAGEGVRIHYEKAETDETALADGAGLNPVVLSPETIAAGINEIYGKSGDDIEVIASVNEIPIYRKEFEYLKYEREQLGRLADGNTPGESGKYTSAEEDIIWTLAERRLVIEDAKNYGVVFTHEDALEFIVDEEKDLRERAADGNEGAVYTLERDRVLFDNLEMSEEEYKKTIFADNVMFEQTYIMAMQAYYDGIDGENVVPYQDYIANLLGEAEVIVY